VGLGPNYLEYIEESVAATLGDLRDKRMLELGDQEIAHDQIPEKTGKEYYENRGVDHTSFDLNGRHGAHRVDLAKPIREQPWLGAFDIVTNSGTTEHVEPFEAQYVCFMNIHNCLKTGGISVHLVPDVDELERRGRCKGHCNYYYSHEFFVLLAELNHYTLVSSKVVRGLRCACLRKNEDRPFTEDRKAVLAAIARKEGGKVYFGINDQSVFGPIRQLLRRVLDVTRPVRRRLGLMRRPPTAH